MSREISTSAIIYQAISTFYVVWATVAEFVLRFVYNTDFTAQNEEWIGVYVIRLITLLYVCLRIMHSEMILITTGNVY